MRKPMVTRTITSTVVTAMVINKETCEVSNKEITLARTYADNKIEKAVENAIKDEPLKLVKIVSSEVKSALYGMSEEDFIANSHVITKAEAEEQ